MSWIDADATPESVQAALDAAEAREGPDFPGWSRTNSALTRKEVWEILRRAPEFMRMGSCGNPAYRALAGNVRREFGIRGQKPALKAPKEFKRRRGERWP